MPTRLNLVVIRVADFERSASFYRSMQMPLTKERHGAGPDHYSVDLGGVVMELYPRRSEAEATTQTRIGFVVDKLDEVLAASQASGGQLIAAAKDSPWGRRAIVKDPDGHTIELVESPKDPSS
jgi:predicted enzyme related to lactoylglutathione lyase